MTRRDSLPSPVRTLPPDPALPEPGTARLCLTVNWSSGGCVLTAVGALDRDSAGVLGTQFEQLVRSGCDAVVVDVSGLRYIDESGGVALAEFWSRVRGRGISCRVHGLHPVFGESPLEFLLALRDVGPTAVTGHRVRHLREVPDRTVDQVDDLVD